MVPGEILGDWWLFFNIKFNFVGEMGMEESPTDYEEQKGQIRPLKLEVPLWLDQVNCCLLESLKLKSALTWHPNFLLGKIVLMY